MMQRNYVTYMYGRKGAEGWLAVHDGVGLGYFATRAEAERRVQDAEDACEDPAFADRGTIDPSDVRCDDCERSYGPHAPCRCGGAS